MLSTLNNTTEDSAMTEYRAEARKVAPQHPGRVLGGLLEDQNISMRAAAKAIGVSHNALANVIAGKSAVTAEMALRLGIYCGNGPELWLNLQQAYDLWHAERALKGELRKIGRAPVAA
jgi:addiction module HigA family antidote